MDHDRIDDTIRAALAPEAGPDPALELYDWEFDGSALRVFVQSEGGVGLDLIADLTRRLSRALDEADPIPGRYTLEVSSPGLERRLRRPDHFAAACGSTVKIRTLPGGTGERRITGVITASDEATVTVLGDDGDVRVVKISDIERARTVFEWVTSDKPGGPRPGRKAAPNHKSDSESGRSTRPVPE